MPMTLEESLIHATKMNTDVADRLADKLNSDNYDDWFYVAEVYSSELRVLAVYDEDDFLVGYM